MAADAAMTGIYYRGGRAYRAGFPLHSVKLTDAEADAVNRAPRIDTGSDILGCYPSGPKPSLAEFRAMMADITRQALEDMRRNKGE